MDMSKEWLKKDYLKNFKLDTYRKKEGPLMRHWDDVGKLQKGQFLPPPPPLSLSFHVHDTSLSLSVYLTGPPPINHWLTSSLIVTSFSLVWPSFCWSD
jgi:hypothetical protein